MSISRFRQQPDYWDQKLANYLHDPPDKALFIPGHEDRSRELTDLLNIPTPDKDFYQRADGIASGLDRAQVPGYSADPNCNGAINFGKQPMITHPTGSRSALRLEIPAGLDCAGIAHSLQGILKKDLESLSESEKYKNNPTAYAPARFHYVHHILRERLARENVGGLGGLWQRMPADTRIPDHSIWQHCSLVSALTSCFALSEKHQASLMVISLTPVQDFIGRARKLRDFWTGSLILSWLAFEGILQVILSLGADHVIYPSLIGQPMVNRLLVDELHFDPSWWQPGSENLTAGVASFPNKFVCLVPQGQENQMYQDIAAGMQQAWLDLGDNVREMVERKLNKQDVMVRQQFRRQLETFWDVHWSACPLLDKQASEMIRELLPASVWERPLDFLEKSAQLPYATKGEGAFYSLTHALAQSFLAAGKTCRRDRRDEEPGIKCNLHGDFEALHLEWGPGDDHNPRPQRDPFWQPLKDSWGTKSDFKASERLSALGLVKRLAYRVCQQMPGHPLKPFFDEAESFPSTTEMALADWLHRVEQTGRQTDLGRNWRKILAQVVHDQEGEDADPAPGSEITEIQREERAAGRRLLKDMEKIGHPIRDEDKYFAILVMDGDRTGRLVNGETLASRWKTVLHPELVQRMQKTSFEKSFGEFWQTELPRQRLLAPGVHAAISEALGDFSLFTVPDIIQRYRGCLIYAGGDDICAVLPVSTAIPAAREIARRYIDDFLFFPGNTATPQSLGSSWQPAPGRLALHLGQGEEISISAGLLIAHHKKPLAGAMRQAHELLDLAKSEGGRNALAVELAKRSGGSRLFLAQWQEAAWEELQLPKSDTLLDIFIQVGNWLGHPASQSLSSSLVYRLVEFQTGLEALAHKTPAGLPQFLAAQIGRSGTSIKGKTLDPVILGQNLAALVARHRPGKEKVEIDPKSLIVARFIGTCMARAAHGQGGEPCNR